MSGYARIKLLKPLAGIILMAVFGTCMSAFADDARTIVRNDSGGQNQERIALVLGNGDYKSMPTLKNPVPDARAVAEALEKLGFSVDTGYDLSLLEMKEKMLELGTRLARGGVGVFYFSGHGAEIGGTNYLMPVDAEINPGADVRRTALSMNDVLLNLGRRIESVNIVILDACRNNPIPGQSRNSRLGLADVKAPTGTLIAYATDPGSLALDGQGEGHSPYTQALLKALSIPCLKVEEVFKKVLVEVNSSTNGAQQPWYNAKILGDFYFNPCKDQQVSINTKLPSSQHEGFSSEFSSGGHLGNTIIYLGVVVLGLGLAFVVVRVEPMRSVIMNRWRALALVMLVKLGQTPGDKKDTQPYLIGVRGQFAGQKYPLDSEGLILGRNAFSSKVVFNYKNKSIGDAHAKISFDPTKREFILLDLSSGCSTYLNRNHVVPAGKSINIAPGGFFFLGGKEEQFKVDII